MPKLPPPERLIASACLALLLSGCATSGTTNSEAAAVVDSEQDFLQFIGREGYVLHPAALPVPSVYGVTGQVYEIQNGEGYFVLYEFPDEAAARRGVDAVQLDVLGGVGTTLFQRGRLVVAYSGEGSGLTLTLTNALGPAVY